MKACQVPPPGWRCTREPGHEGPCAAIEVTRKRVVGMLVVAAILASCSLIFLLLSLIPESFFSIGGAAAALLLYFVIYKDVDVPHHDIST